MLLPALEVQWTLHELLTTVNSGGIQSCFRFKRLDLQSLMQRPRYSVFGRIDFFSVLQALMVSLGGSLAEDWVLESPELTRVTSV